MFNESTMLNAYDAIQHLKKLSLKFWLLPIDESILMFFLKLE